MRFADGHRTDVGRGRPENEDSWLVDRELGLYAVADGMGGHRAGVVASATAIDTLLAAFGGGYPIDRAGATANAAVFAKAADDAALRGMGTTLTAVALQPDGTAILGHVGDSRAYLMRDGTVTQITDDHSLVEQLVREGRLSPEEAQHHPQRAIITRALGVEPDVEVDTYRVDLKPGDRLLICSDGLTGMLSNDTIAATLRRHADPQQAAETLVDMANQAGGDDNITVVILDALADGDGRGAAAAADISARLEGTGELPVVEDDGGALAVAATSHDVPANANADADADADVAVAPRRPRRKMRGVVVWGLPIMAVVGIAVGAVGWYARRTYYVGLSADRVTLFKGVPGGLLGWQPTVDRRTDLTAADLTEADRGDLKNGHRFASHSDADRFVTHLQQAHDALAGTTTTTGPAPATPPAGIPTDATPASTATSR
ncbi:MAG: family protein phosphatase [Actinomycetota bacterium]|nr:family protein phosphatase [Actinomycetota bacterium]